MLFFSGWGFLIIPLCALLSAISGGVLSAVIEPAAGHYSNNVGPLLGGLIGAGLCWLWGKKINKPREDRVYVNKKTGEETVVKNHHTLMFIPVQYYAIAVLGLFAVIGYNGVPDI